MNELRHGSMVAQFSQEEKSCVMRREALPLETTHSLLKLMLEVMLDIDNEKVGFFGFLNRI